MTAPSVLSIVVPTLGEAAHIGALAAHLREVAPRAEVLVVDGGSCDGTAEIAAGAGLTVLSCAPGRAAQMNLGAQAARGGELLFLHADTRLPDGAAALVSRCLADRSVALGAFGFRFSERGLRIGFVERGARLRNAIRPTPYGDQGIFLRRETFEALGGFADLPVMEDLDLVERARDLGRIAVLEQVATTSARRYLERGPLRLMARHWWLSLRFLAGWRPGPDESIRR